jgi:predicted secreted hydrolase
MSDQGSYSSFVRDAERIAVGFFDTVADTLAGKPRVLRDGTEHDPVVLPRDLAAHEGAQTEWWYYTGHAETETGREFGFEWVFFKRRTDLDRFSLVPLRLLGNPFYFAHFAVTDSSNDRFYYAHRKSANRPLDLPAYAGEENYRLGLGDWSARLAFGDHLLKAGIGSDISFDASLRPVKEVVLNGENGVSFKDEGEASRYFSYTRMAMEGDLVVDGRGEHFIGTAWMDREFGTWEPTSNQKGWDWFSIQLNDGSELMVYQLRDAAGQPTRFSSGSFHASDGSVSKLSLQHFTVDPVGFWTSPRSGAKYPSGWKLVVPSLALELDIAPVIADQELDTRGTTMIVYWEGACRVAGFSCGKEVSGNAYVELVGYDRSHDSPDLSRFLLGEYLGHLRF